MHSPRSATHLPLSVVLKMSRKSAASPDSIPWRRLLSALRLPLFVALIAIGLVRLAIAHDPSAPANSVPGPIVEQRSTTASRQHAQPSPDDFDDSDSEPAPSKEVAELYQQIRELAAAQHQTP